MSVTAAPPSATVRHRYALACGTIASCARVLMAAHAVTGAPDDAPGTESPAHVIATLARSSAGGMATVAGRLLAMDHQPAIRQLMSLPAAGQLEDLAALDPASDFDWRQAALTLVRATVEARLALRSIDALSDGRDLRDALTELLELGEGIAELLV